MYSTCACRALENVILIIIIIILLLLSEHLYSALSLKISNALAWLLTYLAIVVFQLSTFTLKSHSNQLK